jgi:hypothetical protein
VAALRLFTPTSESPYWKQLYLEPCSAASAYLADKPRAGFSPKSAEALRGAGRARLEVDLLVEP